jgi:hypothetical protein
VLEIADLAGAGLLINANKGWFLAQSRSGGVAVEPVGKPDTGFVSAMFMFPGKVVIRAEKGLFLARSTKGTAIIERSTSLDPGYIHAAHDLPGAKVLIGAEKGLFVLRSANDTTVIEPAGKAETGSVLQIYDLPGTGVLLLDTQRGLFSARSRSGTFAVERLLGKSDTGSVFYVHDLPGAGLLIGAEKGLFLARSRNGSFSVDPAVGKPHTGTVYILHDLPGVKVLIGAENGSFLVRPANGTAAIEGAGTADTGHVYDTRDLPGAGVLIGAENGLFLARPANGATVIEPAGKAETGSVLHIFALPGVGALVEAENGLFLARPANGAVTAELLTKADIDFVRYTFHLPGAGELIGSDRGLFLASDNPLSRAEVTLNGREKLDGSPPRPDSDLNFLFNIAHPCASAADKLDLRLSITPSGRSPIEPKFAPQSINTDSPVAAVVFPLRIDKPGEWSFQLISRLGGTERRVGQPQHVTFTSEGLRAWLERWGWWLVGGLGIALALVNAVLFLLARRSVRAWRLATDDRLSTWVLRVATVVLSHLPTAQIWILDLYFRRRRTKISPASPFVPLPLTSGEGKVEPSNLAIAPPWAGKRLWVQGGSGMGKTALFRHVTDSHFRDHDTAFAASARWGCVVVAFPARDFSKTGEDEDDPAWVIDALRATLSSQGVTFADESLLTRFLESGTIGVCIDGLNEVSRTRAVTAFTRRFYAAPMLVTSQQSGDDRYFATLCLPEDIRQFTEDLLRVYLPAGAAAKVIGRISASGLKDAIRSGYDVRLIIDLARSDPEKAALPADRLGLYEAVIAAAWPAVPKDVQREQLNLTMAAAWRMVSERKPNEDTRRLKPDTDLPLDLLQTLADAPVKAGTPVRLVRAVGSDSFEFVHDQMHVYLAARWFAQDGFRVTELQKMIDGSTIWTQAPEARRALWGFVAALLDDQRLIELWTLVKENEDWDTLRRALKTEAEQRGLPQPKATQVEMELGLTWE